MENEQLVLGLLESVLGKGKPDKNKKDHAFHCPICNHKKPKLIVNIFTGQYNCWTCHPATKGKTPVSLFKKLGVEKERMIEMKGYFKGDRTKIEDTETTRVFLPKEFISMTENDKSLEYRRATVYLKNRGINESDVRKYNIGYCKEGRYRNRVIVPSYDKNGQVNYFIARSFEKDPYQKYDAPSVQKTEIVGMEYFVNWSVPVILCEGIFDAIAIKRNVVPLFGKSITKALMLKLVESQVKTVYLALDKDALKEALTYSEQLINLGKEVYLIELDGKDPSDLGFTSMTELLQKAKPLTFGELMLRRMKMN
jgi:DNA primase